MFYYVNTKGYQEWESIENYGSLIEKFIVIKSNLRASLDCCTYQQARDKMRKFIVDQDSREENEI